MAGENFNEVGDLRNIRENIATLAAGAPASAGATAAKQDTIIGHVDGIEASLTTLIGHVDGVEGKLDTLYNGASEYETVAASQTAQALGATGATGDRLSHVNVQPTSTAPGVVTILDNAIEVHAWPGGTVGADLKPFTIPIGANSVSGAWKITTGANVKVTAFGNFT